MQAGPYRRWNRGRLERYGVFYRDLGLHTEINVVGREGERERERQPDSQLEHPMLTECNVVIEREREE